MTRLVTGIGAAAALCAGLLVSGCGGAEKRAPATPAEPTEDESGEEGGSALISDEDLEAVGLYFERKRTIVSRCFNDAMDAGEVPEDVREMYLTVTVTVYPDGKARNVRFSDATVSSERIEGCVREHIDGWSLPEVGQAFEYSHRYGFNAL